MNRKPVHQVLFALAFATVFFQGCDPSPSSATPSGETSIPSTIAIVGKATGIGVPTGPAMRKTIGAGGGNIASADGGLLLSVPPGALSTDVELGIEPITSTVPGAVGGGYRLTPHGTQFAKPIVMTFSYADTAQPVGSPSSLGIAFQTPQNTWQWVKDAAIDTIARTITVASMHFSDWSKLWGWQIRPPVARVKAGASVKLAITYCVSPDADGELAPLVADCNPTSGESLMPLIMVSEVSVNGIPGGNSTVGTITKSDMDLIYTAPGKVPKPSTVTVSARIKARQGKVVLTSSVTVEGSVAPYVGTVTGTGQISLYNYEVTTPVMTLEPTDIMPHDLVKYEGTSTISVTYHISTASLDCDPQTVQVPVKTELIRYDSVRTGTGDKFAGRYWYIIYGNRPEPVQFRCHDKSSEKAMILPLVVIVSLHNGCASEGPSTFAEYTDESELTGSANSSCNALGTTSTSWSFMQGLPKQ